MTKDLYVLDNLKETNAGSASAQYNLGGCYANGDGVVKDSARAVEWFRSFCGTRARWSTVDSWKVL